MAFRHLQCIDHDGTNPFKRTESNENCGASSVIHFASLQLGLEERESREVLPVAQRLNPCPC